MMIAAVHLNRRAGNGGLNNLDKFYKLKGEKWMDERTCLN